MSTPPKNPPNEETDHPRRGSTSIQGVLRNSEGRYATTSKKWAKTIPPSSVQAKKLDIEARSNPSCADRLLAKYIATNVPIVTSKPPAGM